MTRFCATLVTTLMATMTATAQAAPLPEPTSPEFCRVAQRILASTSMAGTNTVFTDMPEYRHSKPMVNPLTNYQVVTYRGQVPIVVSCKVKTAAHLRAEYGEKTAGEQRYCPAITRMVRDEAATELRREGNTAAAATAASYVVDQIEPYTTGQSYLSDFKPSYVGTDGKVHLNSPGLFQDYDSWITLILPEIVKGQSYCHLPTVEYVKALATGAMEPGTTVTTTDDAPVTPR